MNIVQSRRYVVAATFLLVNLLSSGGVTAEGPIDHSSSQPLTACQPLASFAPNIAGQPDSITPQIPRSPDYLSPVHSLVAVARDVERILRRPNQTPELRRAVLAPQNWSTLLRGRALGLDLARSLALGKKRATDLLDAAKAMKEPRLSGALVEAISSYGERIRELHHHGDEIGAHLAAEAIVDFVTFRPEFARLALTDHQKMRIADSVRDAVESVERPSSDILIQALRRVGEVEGEAAEARANLLAGLSDPSAIAKRFGPEVLHHALDGMTGDELAQVLVLAERNPGNPNFAALIREIANHMGLTENAFRQTYEELWSLMGDRVIADAAHAVKQYSPAPRLGNLDDIERYHSKFRRPTNNVEYQASLKLEAGPGFEVQLENPIMKYQNTKVFPNPLLSGMINNFGKKTFYKAAARFRVTDPATGQQTSLIKMIDTIYEGYKGLNIRFRADTPEIREVVQEVYGTTVLAADGAIRDNPILRRYYEALDNHHGMARHPASWIIGGTGKTSPRAAAAARVAREGFREGQRVTPMLDFESPFVQKRLSKAFDEMDEARHELGTALNSISTNAFELGADGNLIPSLALGEIARRASDLTIDSEYEKFIGEAIQARFHLALNPAHRHSAARALKNYYRAAQLFSQPVFESSAQLGSVELSTVPGDGTLTLFDLRGAGANNNQRLFRALASARKTLPVGVLLPYWAVDLARRAQDEGTQDFNVNRSRIEEGIRASVISPDLRFSPDHGIRKTGDDVFFAAREPLDQPQQLDALASVAVSGGRARMISVDRRGFSSAQALSLLSLGGLVEKHLREKVEGAWSVGKLPYEFMENISIGVLIRADSEGRAKVRLAVVGHALEGNLAPVQAAMPGVVAELQAEAAKAGIELVPDTDSYVIVNTSLPQYQSRFNQAGAIQVGNGR